MILLLGIDLYVLWSGRTVFLAKYRVSFFLCTLMPMLSMVLQIIFPASRTILFAIALAALVVFLFILTDQVDHHVRQAEENARQRASIAVLEMRPHFIYNTMMSIYYLCKQDPKKAQEVTLNFTNYLRKNFTAISKETPIPFSEEILHTKAYLAVEQVRFEGELYVEFDTPRTLFRVPPLTLQPIVENAVKHGVSPGLSPLYILIRTRETEDGSEVIVEDNGPGFSPPPTTSRISHSQTSRSGLR